MAVMPNTPRLLYISQFLREKSANPLKRLWSNINSTRLTGQDGFLRGSLHHQFDVTERGLPWFLAHQDRIDRDFDYLVINHKCHAARNQPLRLDDLGQLNRLTLPKALAVTNAEPDNLPEDSLLDPFDVLFKREPYIDRNRYSIRQQNRDKMHATMLACPLVTMRTGQVRRKSPTAYGFTEPSDVKNYDVFFSGATTAFERVECMETLQNQDFRLKAFLQPKWFADRIPPAMRSNRKFDLDLFVKYLRETKVNLALSGYGPFTFRHLELWCLCSFAISTPAIRGLELPMPAVEGVDHVCFENQQDLIDKVRHYLDHPEERRRIALAGRRLFEENYSFAKHGIMIRKVLSA